MGKVKDFMSEPEVVTEPVEMSYEEIIDYYRAKNEIFDTDVVQFNSNLLSIIDHLCGLKGEIDTKIQTESEKIILKAIKLLKLEEDKEK